MEQITAFFVGLIFSAANVLGLHHSLTLAELPVLPPAPAEATSSTATVQTSASSSDMGTETMLPPDANADIKVSAGLSAAQLLAMASNAYADGNVPLGDYHYVTDAPKKGYVYLCNVHKDNPGSMVNGPWMHDSTWNFLQKVSVSGSVSWPNAKFSDYISGVWHVFTGNGLPVGYPTGVFPVASTDAAAKYDKNPNTITAQTLSQKLPAGPTYSATPYCMGGEVGIMSDGVPIFNAFDAGLRDAPAHELQDKCDGHPQGSGEYHYHSLSDCFKDIMVSTVLGYALDGFPITGPEVAPGKFLTTDDLDVCHGITSDVKIQGKIVTTYHYVMTRDFPYSASCFRGKPASLFVIAGAGPQGQQSQVQTQRVNVSTQESAPPQGGAGVPPVGGPPQAATSACSGSASGNCSFTDDHGSHAGTCQSLPSGEVACVPHS